jgi:predicted HAD superfamily Cof-like phosphohydrolase
MKEKDMGLPSIPFAVGMFQEKFGLMPPEVPTLPTKEQFDFKMKHIREELDELEKAFNEGNLVDFADGLVDTVYVALGLSHFAGIPFLACFHEVHRANMKKERAKTEADSKRGSKLDIVKPKGWNPPNLRKILIAHGADI